MACASNCYGCSKQMALSFMPAWLVPVPGWSQSFSFSVCALCTSSRAPGGNLCSTSHVGEKKPSSNKAELLSGAERTERTFSGTCGKSCGSGRMFALPTRARDCLSSDNIAAVGSGHVPWGRCCCPTACCRAEHRVLQPQGWPGQD